MSPIEFQAPWSRSLKMTTSVGATLLVVLIVLAVLLGAHMGAVARIALIGVSLVVLLGSAALLVRGYTLTQDEILVRRLGWVTKLPLTNLQAVEGNADAMRGSLRLLGIVGLFSFVGWHWNKPLRLYLALATDPSRAVILRYPRRTIVITPHDPQQFIMRARTLLNTTAFRV